ncbi:hypothetical protein D9M72_611740 [compost metagenome]
MVSAVRAGAEASPLVSNMKRGAFSSGTPFSARAVMGSESSTANGYCWTHSEPVTILVSRTAIGFPATFNTSTRTPPSGDFPAGSLMVQSPG